MGDKSHFVSFTITGKNDYEKGRNPSWGAGLVV